MHELISEFVVCVVISSTNKENLEIKNTLYYRSEMPQ